MNTPQDDYNALCFYTLAHGDPAFIHQHVVDAFTAQTSDEKVKPIKITFALVGLFLHVERQFTGRQVQLAHMQLAQKKQPWPVLMLPASRGEITVREVLAAPAGPERDEMIRRWCVSVWHAFGENRAAVANLLGQNGII